MKRLLTIGLGLLGIGFIIAGIVIWISGIAIHAWAYGIVVICYGVLVIDKAVRKAEVEVLQERVRQARGVIDTSLHERRRDERMNDEEYQAGYEHGLGT